MFRGRVHERRFTLAVNTVRVYGCTQISLLDPEHVGCMEGARVVWTGVREPSTRVEKIAPYWTDGRLFATDGGDSF